MIFGYVNLKTFFRGDIDKYSLKLIYFIKNIDMVDTLYEVPKILMEYLHCCRAELYKMEIPYTPFT